MPPQRFPGGITNIKANEFLSTWPLPDPRKHIVFFDDFLRYNPHEWTVTADGGGTSALQNEANGILKLTNEAVGDSAVTVELGDGTSVIYPFNFGAGKQYWFSARFKVSDALNSYFSVGLASVAGGDVSDYLLFNKASGDNTVKLSISSSAAPFDDFPDLIGLTNPPYILGEAVNNTYITCEVFGTYPYLFKARSCGVECVSDNTGIVGIGSGISPMTVVICVGNGTGNAVANSLSIDYIMFAMER